MTTYNKTSLKTFFETNDVPSGTDYANLIDSQVNIAETAEQQMAGALNTTELITPRVSATNANFTGLFSANNISMFGTLSANNITAFGTIYFNNITIGSAISTQSINVSIDVSAGGTVYASAMRSTNGFIGSSGIVSAAGTTQGAAAVLTNVINNGKGVADGVTTGFTPLANRTGLVQYLFNEGVSANLWPPTGGKINGLAANAAFALAASASYTIFHISASAYGVK